jgi:hypothetical protein
VGASTVTFDLADGLFVNQAFTGALTIAAPLFRGGTVNSDVVPIGTRFIIRLKNTSGGGLVITWNAIFKTEATPTIATVTNRTFEFIWDGTNWIRIGAAPTDLAN